MSVQEEDEKKDEIWTLQEENKQLGQNWVQGELKRIMNRLGDYDCRGRRRRSEEQQG